MTNSKEHYLQLIKKIHGISNKEIITKVSEIISLFSGDISVYFYNEILGNVKAAHFINNNIVKKRLQKSLSDWINLSLLYKDSDEKISEYINYQEQIGIVHGRIDLPTSFVNYGMYLIKEYSSRVLRESVLGVDELDLY